MHWRTARGAVASAARSAPTKQEAKPRYFHSADSRYSVAKTSKHVCGSFSVDRCSSARTSMSRIRTKKAPDRDRGRSTTSKLTVDLACRLGLDHPAGHL